MRSVGYWTFGVLSILAAVLLNASFVLKLADDAERTSKAVGGLDTVVHQLNAPASTGEVWRIGGVSGCGSGWLIQCDPAPAGQFRFVLITAAHVVEGSTEFIADNGDGVGLTGGKILSVHPSVDAAAVEFFGPVPALPREWTTELMPRGTVVVSAGWPWCFNRWATLGLICEPGSLSALAAPGCSGGPITTIDGVVCGIVTGALANGFEVVEMAGYYVPTSAFAEWALNLP